MKYALVVARGRSVPRDRTDELECLTGLFQWLNLFNGVQLSLEELDKNALEHYDLLHVNVTSHQCDLVSRVRKLLGKSSSTKLICNIDYAVELMPQLFIHPNFSFVKVLKSMKDADLTFSVEPTQRELLEQFVKFKIPLIPHPCNTKELKSFRRGDFDRDDEIAVIYHRYYAGTFYPYALFEKWKLDGYKTAMYGLTDPLFGSFHYGKFDKMQPRVQGAKFLEMLSHAKLAIEPYHLHSYGRFTLDTACLGIPTVCSKYVYSGQVCWPQTLVNPFSFNDMRKELTKLAKDGMHYEEVRDYAFDVVEEFNHENSRKKLLGALEQGKAYK